MPKNVVLLAMMEAAERQKGYILSSMSEDSDGSREGEDAENGERKRILKGLQTLSGSCGTYALVENLAVLPFDPRRDRNKHTGETVANDETVEPFEVEKGQTVQVVEVSDGVVRLARGKGFIVASNTQLVKVGGPLDKSCQLEGILDSVASRKRELERELRELEDLSRGLGEEVQLALSQEPSHPIITPTPEIERPSSPKASPSPESSPVPRSPIDKLKITTSEDSVEIARSPDQVAASLHDSVELTHETPPQLSPSNLMSPHTIDNADLSATFFVDDDSAVMGNSIPEQLGCEIFGATRCVMDEDEGLIGLSFDIADTFGTVAPAPPPRLRPSARTSTGRSPGRRIIPSPSMSSSFDSQGINFRTGMSGHCALGHSKQRSGTAQPQRLVRFMGEHRGIGKLRRQHHQHGAPDSPQR